MSLPTMNTGPRAAVQPRRKRIATFSFKVRPLVPRFLSKQNQQPHYRKATTRGVVAASSKESASRMREAMEHLSAIVISTYKVCMDQNKTLAAKHSKLAEITSVEPDLISIVDFTAGETANCKVERVKVKMMELATALDRDSRAIREEFAILRADPHIYQKIFDGLLRFMENATAFLKEGHSVEQARVLDAAFEAVQEVRKIRDATDEDSLVDIGQVASRKCLDLLRAAKRLVSVQESTQTALGPRLENAQALMQTSLPSFLQKCKDRIEFPTDENVERQQESLSQITAILEEIINTVKEVRPDYDSSFADQVVDAEDPNALKLREAISKVSGMLTKLHTMDGELNESRLIKSEVVDLTRSVLPELDMTNAEKAEFVTAVKQGLEPSHKDFFESQKKFTSLTRKPKATIVEAEAEEDSKDLIEAAKGMLSALKGISTALAEAPELQN